MKKETKYFKKAVTMLTTMAMAAMAMAGCGSSEGGSSETGVPPTDSSGTAGGQESQENQESTGAFDFDSVSDVVFPLSEKLTLDVFVYASNTGGGTMQDNYVTEVPSVT